MIDNKPTMLKFISRHRKLLGCLIFAWIIVFFIGRNVSSKLKIQVLPHPLIHPLQHNRLPPSSSFKMVKALRYCNPPNDITLGHEGKAPNNGSLEFVAVVIRHGDRAPLRPIRNQTIINCGSINDPILAKYVKTLRHLRGSAKHLIPFTTFPLQPAEKQCISGQMTLMGAHQQIITGMVLQKAYIERHNLLSKNWTSKHVKLYSTILSRTFQSAVAFLYGFLPTFNISNIKIYPSPDFRFCMTSEHCHCPLALHLQQILDRKMKKLLDSHPAVMHLIERLNPIVKDKPQNEDLLDPFMMFDSLTGYVCHGSHLPCIPGSNQCVTFEHVRNILAYLDWQGRQFTKDPTNLKASTLVIFGFLNNLLGTIKTSIMDKDPTRFALYSGHDVTVAPLVTALGIDDGNIIPYASRVAFEVYSHYFDGQLSYAVKVIFNGKDVTKYTIFCKKYFRGSVKTSEHSSEYGICPLESMQKFVEGYIASLGASSFRALCDSVQSSSYPFDVKSDSNEEDLNKE